MFLNEPYEVDEIHPTSWEDVQKLANEFGAEEYEHGHSMYLFRGQGNADWSLHPSLTRATSRIDGASAMVGEYDAQQIEQQLLSSFREQAHKWLSTILVGHSRRQVLNWWTVMQHYGAPTRLLDWTESFYVGLYFAIVSQLGSAGALWGVSRRIPFGETPKTEEEIAKRFFRSDEYRVMFFTANELSDRMTAQQGRFSVADRIYTDHAAANSRAADQYKVDYPKDARVFFKITIPADLKPEVLARLRSMNITAAALFPGIDGLGKSIAETCSALVTSKRLELQRVLERANRELPPRPTSPRQED